MKLRSCGAGAGSAGAGAGGLISGAVVGLQVFRGRPLGCRQPKLSIPTAEEFRNQVSN